MEQSHPLFITVRLLHTVHALTLVLRMSINFEPGFWFPAPLLRPRLQAVDGYKTWTNAWTLKLWRMKYSSYRDGSITSFVCKFLDKIPCSHKLSFRYLHQLLYCTALNCFHVTRSSAFQRISWFRKPKQVRKCTQCVIILQCVCSVTSSKTL